MGRYRCHGPKCHGAPFHAQSGQAVRCCGADCEAELAAQETAIGQALAQAGFERDAHAPNVWRKGGAAVTTEECRHNGVEKAIEKHARIIHAD